MITNTNHRITLRAALSTAAGAALFFSPIARVANAQDSRSRAEIMAKDMRRFDPERIPELMASWLPDSKRAVIGVTTRTDYADSLGVLIDGVTPGSPADKAGIKAGSRITAVNGVSMRVSGADASDPELKGLAQRRLQREIQKAKAGDEVELRITNNGNAQTLKVKTVSAGELDASRVTSNLSYSTRAGAEKRASLGVSVGSTGSARDTLGLFISSVITNGPAEKAGVFEGDRIAAINGVDVRVPREDAEDAQATMARVNRFTRELAKLTPGDKVTLRVYGGGRFREVQVTTGTSTDLIGSGFHFRTGDGETMMSLPGGLLRAEPGVFQLAPGGVIRKSSPTVIRRVTPAAAEKISPVVIRKVTPATARTASPLVIRRKTPVVIRTEIQ